MQRNRPSVAWQTLVCTAASILFSLALLPDAHAQGEESSIEPSIERDIASDRPVASGLHGTANSNCAGAECDTVWVGHNSTGPGGPFLGVGVGGTWDFDSGIAGSDSTQGWRRWAFYFRSGVSLPAAQRPAWAYDYGNMANEGNTALWNARALAGRKFVKTGVAGVWHSDTMAGVKLNINNPGEPSATPIAGSRSAWCGFRESGNTTAQDALTGNYINADLLTTDFGVSGTSPEFPGYTNLMDQMMYKDFGVPSGSGTLDFKVRTDMSNFVDTSTNGSGWFNPDPTSIGNFVNNPADSFMVYVGSPNEVAYDTNRRWFSEVLDLTRPHQQLFSVSGKFPYVSADTALTRNFADLSPVAGKLRVVFRVKTNRVRSDITTSTPTGYNSKDGAAVVDDVRINGGTVHGFESAASLTARALIPDLALDGGPWATTGRPPATYHHVANVATLLYEDLCGAVGSPTRQCNLSGNVMLPGDNENGNQIAVESYLYMESPTIDLAVRSAAPGTKNGQGIDAETAQRSNIVIDFDIYYGDMDIDESVFYFPLARGYAPSTYRQPISGHPIWSHVSSPVSLQYNSLRFCYNNPNPQNIAALGLATGQLDSLKIGIATLTQGYRFGGTNLGNTRGTYFDNIRVGFVRTSAPVVAWTHWDKFQDQFPANEGVAPGDNAAFDTTAALMTTGLNLVTSLETGVVPGDSIVVESPYLGDGVTEGTRVDLVFRIDPGPGNYTVRGDRTSPLVNRDPAHPFFASYLANNGQFGTPGGHGARWNKDVWNSARMDSAQVHLSPINLRSIGTPVNPEWMGTLHESDPRYATLGIERPLCFLVDPTGPADATNIDCSGTPPAIYGAVSGSTKEGTKIIPDGWFTPGTHIEYFVRRSLLSNPANAALIPDTNLVYLQDPGGRPDYDAERWESVDVLPDMWKSTRYGGSGLACVLMVDANDRRGADRTFRGAADTLGFGKNNGAAQGWKGLGPAATSQLQANDPAGFVAANLGQYGLSFDHFDVNSAESDEAGHLGSRFASQPGAIALKGDRSGPSASQLATFYSGIFYSAGDNGGAIHNGTNPQESADDIALLEGWLAGASNSNRRNLWLSGDDLMEDAWYDTDPKQYTFYTETFGVDLTAENYKVTSQSARSTAGFLPQAGWAHPGRVYGIDHTCLVRLDVLQAVATVDGASVAANYEAFPGPGPWTASVYRPLASGREFRTLFDGFSLQNLTGNFANLGEVGVKSETDNGRIAWFDDVWTGHFSLCARRGPVIAVGEVPGVEGARFTNALLQSFPNPAFAGRSVNLRFTLARAQEVTIRVFNVAGREVALVRHAGAEGPNAVTWDGVLSNGAKATPGVYFYRLDGIDVGPSGSAQKMILLGQN